MSTYIPVTTLSNLRDNFVPPSLSDLLYLQQGSEHDRDSAGTLGQILASQVIQSFLSDRDNWRTFTAPETGIITLGDYNRNVIIVPSKKDQDIRLDHFPTNGLIIYAPDWRADSSDEAVTISEIGNTDNSLTITKGGVGIFLCSGDLVIGQGLIGSSALALAQLKKLTVDNLIVQSTLTLPALSILSGNIANGAVTTDKIGNGAVTKDKIYSLAVTTDKIAAHAVTADKIGTGAVTNYKIEDKAVDSFKLADQLAFVKTPKFPRKVYKTEVVTGNITFEDIDPNYDGITFSTDGTFTIAQMMHFTDADSRFEVGDTYRIYNDTPNIIDVYDYVSEAPYEIYTKIQAWTFKDFYYDGGWTLA